MNRIIRVGSRKSLLAMTQTKLIIEELKHHFPEYTYEIVEITTTGDRIQDVKLDKIGGKGLFIKELEDAMAEGRIDFAVHSLKDMPAELEGDTKIVAISKRVNPMDVLVMPVGKKISDLREDSIIGTSSIRRERQILKWRPKSKIKMLRGNVPTRIRKLDEGEYDAIVLAAAGLIRLGLSDRITYTFSESEMLPSVGQGALAIEAPKNSPILHMLEILNDRKTQLETEAERAFSKSLGGSCSTPIGALAVLSGETIELKVMYGEQEKEGYKQMVKKCKVSQRNEVAIEMAEQLRRLI
ncbi:MAG: hydroxymethylbilane synthase [Clostridiales bacterium]|nr:MAG: hydroxymethylbilane synthase [Clostridiales bacterium]